jgi:hypothetical protein
MRMEVHVQVQAGLLLMRFGEDAVLSSREDIEQLYREMHQDDTGCAQPRVLAPSFRACLAANAHVQVEASSAVAFHEHRLLRFFGM